MVRWSIARQQTEPRDTSSHYRVVLLGASNLLRGIGSIFEIAREVWGRPLDLMAALGHGRSYGLVETRVMLRGLPGILRCGIWDSLDRRPQAPTATLLTDIGNDLLYDVTVPQITAWVEQCLVQCSRFSERMVVTELPLSSLSHISRWQFFLLRSALFPGSRLSYTDGIERAEQLNDEVRRLAQKFGAVVVQPRTEWYGLDPIHIRRRSCHEAWQTILSFWSHKKDKLKCKRSLRRSLYLRSLRPEERRLFSFFQYQSQPVGHLRDGSQISFY